jgi:hypothetical protein
LFLINCIRFKSPFYFQRIKNPRTFNEKISFIKFNVRNPKSPIVADKYEVRKFVGERIGSNFLVPLIGVFDRIEDIDFNVLPKKFVLKLNNGSGFNYICLDKQKLDVGYVTNLFKKALNTNIYYLSREWHYKEIKSRLVIEKFLGSNIKDYKVHCNKEEGPFCIQVDLDRFSLHKRSIYDLNWNKLDIKYVYSIASSEIDKPLNFDLMLELARKLSVDFIYSRIDFYEIEGDLYFGEITLHPEGGVGPFNKYYSDLFMGGFIKI